MALVIDPKQEGTGGGRSYTGPGKKLLWAAGIEWGTSQAGNQKIRIRFACVGDPEQDGKDEGTQVFDTFTLTDNAAWKIRQFAVAAKQNEPFDAENQDQMNEILGRRPVWAEIEIGQDHNGNDRSQIIRYVTFAGEVTDKMQDVVEDLERYHAEGKTKMAASSGGGFKSTVPASTDIPF